MAEIIETFENTEQTMSPEYRAQLIENFLESGREAELAGNRDMAEYYQGKARELQDANNEGARLGGFYAGYTANQWREMAKDEFIKNGESMTYKRYCDNAMKANS